MSAAFHSPFRLGISGRRAPYLAHLRVREGGTSKDYLLGRSSFLDPASGVRIVDWRVAPVAQIFYRYREGSEYEETFPGRVAEGVVEARRIVSEFSPDVAVGTGGYVSAPVLVAARLAGVPVALQEQNASPGLTNRFLGRIADEVYLNFPESRRSFPERARAVVTGNPITLNGQQAPDRTALLSRWGLASGRRTLMVMGGSQGARRLNEITTEMLARYPGGYPDYLVNHQRKPGIGPLAGWRGPKGDHDGLGPPNERQLEAYVANGCFWRYELAPEELYLKPVNRAYLARGRELGLLDTANPIKLHLYCEILQRFRLAAEGHGPVQPPDGHRARIREQGDRIVPGAQRLAHADVALGNEDVDRCGFGGHRRGRFRRLLAAASQHRRNATGGNGDCQHHDARGFHTLTLTTDGTKRRQNPHGGRSSRVQGFDQLKVKAWLSSRD